MSEPKSTFKFREETLKRCRTIQVDAQTEGHFCKISLEFFHFFYNAKKLDFAIYFRVGDTLVEFIKPEELSKQLLDEVWAAMQKRIEGLSVCIQRRDHPRFENFIIQTRRQKIANLAKKVPDLDQKTLDIYGNLSSASQLIVAGGIDSGVAASVKASASFMVSNMLDSDRAVDTLSRMITCDPTLYDHSAAVAMLASVVCRSVLTKPLSVNETQVVAQCALYHDVGKTCVPNNILNKPGKFTPAEFEVMKTHTTLGHNELKHAIEQGLPIDELAARVAHEHHEKYQGGGYPLNKKGRYEDDPVNGIHLYTRIVTIADIYSALLMKRVYKDAFEPQDAVKIMAEGARDLDPVIFPQFLKAVVSSLNAQVERMQGGKGRILEINADGQLAEIKRGA